MKKAALILTLVTVAAACWIRVLRASTQGASATAITHPASSYQASSTGSLNTMRLLTAPDIDGDFSDWPATDSINVDRDTAYSFSGRIDNPADLGATVRSGWDQANLYFALRISDDVLMADSTDVWRDDGIEIGIDGLHDKYAWGFDDHQYTVVVDGRTGDRGIPTTDVITAIQAYEGGYNIEVAIPLSLLLPGIPDSETVMGFTVGLHDDDDGGNWDAYLIWEGTNTSSRPEQYGSLVFADRPEDRLAALEARLQQLEQQLQQLLTILGEFDELPPP